MPWTIRIALIVAGVLLAISAVGLWSTRPQAVEARPTLLKLGVLPGVASDELLRRHAPLAEYLSRHTKIPCEVVIPEDYEDLVEMIGRGDVDLAWLGALTFIKAHDRFCVVPLAMRDVDARFTTVFVVRPEHANASLEELRGLRIAFASEDSTSGYLMAKHHLLEAGWSNKDLEGAHHHATHDKTVYDVRDNDADIGAVNGLVLEALYESGDVSSKDIVVLDRSEPYVDYVWAARSNLSPALRQKIREALLELDPMDDDDKVILKSQQCAGYLPALIDDFDDVRSVAEDLGMLGAD